MNESKIIIAFAILIFNGFGYLGALHVKSDIGVIAHAIGMLMGLALAMINS